MKLLITGATGLVGQALVAKALSDGIQIHFLTTNKTKTKSIKGTHGFFWNPAKGELDTDCFSGVDTIIHLAGASISKPWTSSYKKEIFSSRTETTQLLLSSLKKLQSKHRVKQIISASAIGIYPSDFKNTMTESSSIQAHTFMEKVVVAWEKEVDTFAAQNIKIAKMRIGLVLTPKGGVLGPLKIPTSIGLGAAFGNGKQGQSWIHIADVVNIFLQAYKEQWEGVYNVVAPNPVSQTAFIKALAKAQKRPFFLPPIPKLLLKLIVGEMSSLVLDSHWVSAKKILDRKYSFLYPQLDQAIDDVLQASQK